MAFPHLILKTGYSIKKGLGARSKDMHLFSSKENHIVVAITIRKITNAHGKD